jgi:hypothetical protein
MGPLKSPPPVRRIVVDEEPTVVEPPKGRPGTKTVQPAASGLLSAPRKREAKRGKVRQRMKTEELGVAYAGRQAGGEGRQPGDEPG